MIPELASIGAYLVSDIISSGFTGYGKQLLHVQKTMQKPSCRQFIEKRYDQLKDIDRRTANLWKKGMEHPQALQKEGWRSLAIATTLKSVTIMGITLPLCILTAPVGLAVGVPLLSVVVLTPLVSRLTTLALMHTDQNRWKERMVITDKYIQLLQLDGFLDREVIYGIVNPSSLKFYYPGAPILAAITIPAVIFYDRIKGTAAYQRGLEAVHRVFPKMCASKDNIPELMDTLEPLIVMQERLKEKTFDPINSKDEIIQAQCAANRVAVVGHKLATVETYQWVSKYARRIEEGIDICLSVQEVLTPNEIPEGMDWRRTHWQDVYFEYFTRLKGELQTRVLSEAEKNQFLRCYNRYRRLAPTLIPHRKKRMEMNAIAVDLKDKILKG